MAGEGKKTGPSNTTRGTGNAIADGISEGEAGGAAGVKRE